MTIGLPIWVVYKQPRDFPGDFVARLWDGLTNQPTTSLLTAPTIEALRARLPPELNCIGRHETDDPVIVEAWL